MIPVHNHSHYSARDGFGTVPEIADQLQSLGLPGGFLTDHGTVAGVLEFRKVLTERNLFAGFGMEAYHAAVSRKEKPKGRDQAHLVLLAKNEQGYRNLMRLSDEAGRTGFHYVPRVDWDLLERHSEGIIATSACVSGLVPQGIKEDSTEALNKYLSIFGDDFYIEIHTYTADWQRDVNEGLYQIARERGIPMVVANDAHYPSQDDYVAHEVMIAMKDNREYDPESHVHPPCLYIMSEGAVRTHLAYLPKDVLNEAISNTEVIMESCRFNLPPVKMHMPKAGNLLKKSSDEVLIDKVEQGLKGKYLEITPAIEERAAHELESIIEAGLSDYFLITEDVVRWAKRQGILIGPGRGSVGGSILAYALDITDIDPLAYGLFFERFWNPGRSKGFPDIDLDFEDERRDEVKEYVIKKYGADRVLSIGTKTEVGPKMAINDVARVVYPNAIPFKDLKDMRDLLDSTTAQGITSDWPDIWEKIGDKLEPYRRKYPDLFKWAEIMTNRIRQYSTHASAVVISDIDLPEYLPCRQDRKEMILLTQFDMRDVEAEGFLKVDFLGLRTLTTLSKAANIAGYPNFFWNEIHRRINEMPEAFWQQVDKGLTLGFFQIEDGKGAKDIARRLKPRSIAELGLCVALNRPGALLPGGTDRYLAVKEGKREPRTLHPDLDPILEETHGEIIYQEQVLAILAALGYSLSEADEVRKMMGKKKTEDMKKELPRFMERAKNLLSDRDANRLWEDCENFSRYGFNKSHAIGYGIILSWCMYAKMKWPTEYIMAGITTAPDKEHIGKWISEGKRLGVAISPPNINKSRATISKLDDQIYYGLADVKGVGQAAAHWIMANAPFKSVAHLEAMLESRRNDWERNGKNGLSPKTVLKSNAIQALYEAGAFDTLEERDISDNDKVKLEEELLGIAITDVVTPIIESNREEIDKLIKPDEVDGPEDSVISVVGVVKNVKETKVRSTARRNAGEKMAFVDIEWEDAELSITAFPDAYASCKYMLKPRTVGKFELKLQSKGPVLVGGYKFV